MDGVENVREVTVLQETDGYVVGRLDHLCILRTRVPLSVEAIDALYAELVAMSGELGEQVATLVIPGARRPTVAAHVRARAAVVWPLVGERSKAVAIWIRQGSFAGAIQRSIASAMLLLIRRGPSIKICSSAAGVTEFMAARQPELESVTRDWAPALDRFAAAFDPDGVRPAAGS